MRYFLPFLLFLTILFLLPGCKEGNTVSSPDTTNYNSDPETYPLPETFETSSPTNKLVVFRACLPTIGTNWRLWFDVGFGFAKFGTPGQDKGEFSVIQNFNTYVFIKKNLGGSTSYIYIPSAFNTSGLPLYTNETKFTFKISGYSLTDSIIKVPGPIHITYPQSKSIIPKTQQLTINWYEYMPGEQKVLVITDKSGKHIYKKVDGTSSTFSTSELGSLSTGTAQIYILTYNYLLTNNGETVLIGEAVSYNTITLQ